MWDRPRFLGQVPISPGAGFGGSPWEFGGTPSGSYYANAQGTPLMTEQMNSPEHFEEEYHCYRSPAGAFVSIPFAQRDAYLAAGYVAVDSANCVSSRVSSLMGPRRMGADAPSGGGGGAQGSPQGGGQGGAQGTPTGGPTGGGRGEGNFEPGFAGQFGYPMGYPQGYPGCTWQKDANGNDVYVCPPTSGIPVVYPGAYGLMGRRRRMGAGGGGGGRGGGAGGFGGGGLVASGIGFETGDPFYFPQYPLVAPPQYAPVPPPGTTCSWEKDVSGNDVYVCRQASGAVVTMPPVASYGPVVYPAQSLFY